MNTETLFWNNPLGIVYQNSEGKISDANKAAEKALGLSVDQMQESYISGFKREDGTDLPEEDHPAMIALHSGKPVNNIILGFLNQDTKAYIWLNTNAVPEFREGEDKPYQVYTILVDITEHRNTKEELKTHHEHLEDYINKHTFDLDQEITQREGVEKEFDNMLHFNALMIKLAFEYVNLPIHKLDKAINNFLMEIGRFLNADRSYIFHYNWDKNTASNTYEWCNKGILPQIEYLQETQNDIVPEWIEAHKLGKPVIVPDVAALPKDSQLRDLLEPQKIKSLITIPLIEENSCFGFVGIDFVKNSYDIGNKEMEMLVIFAKMVLNFTQQQHRAMALIESQSLQKSTIDGLMPNIALLNAQGQIILVNKAWKEFSNENNGLDQNNFVGVNYLMVCEQASGEDSSEALSFAEGIKKVLSGEIKNYSLEYPCHSPTEQRWFYGYVTKIVGDGEQRAVVSHVNITDRKLALDALKESENKFKTLVTENEEIIFMLDREGTLILSEGKGLKKLGLKPGQVVGLSIFDIFQDYPEVLEKVRKVLQGETITTEVKIDETYYNSWYTPQYNIKGEFIGILGMSIDITEQKKSENALIESESRLSALLTNLPGMAYRCRSDKEWTLEYVSDGCLDLTGYSSSDLINNGKIQIIQLLHPDDYKHVWGTIQDALKDKRSFEIEYRIITADDSIKHVLEKGIGIFDGGRLLFLEGFIIDITERKQVEDKLAKSSLQLHAVHNKLKESEEKYKNLIKNAKQPIITIDGNGKYVLINESAAKKFGGKPEDFIGSTLWDTFPKEEADKRMAVHQEVIQSGKTITNEVPFKVRDEEKWFLSTIQPIQKESIDDGVLVMATDITHRKQAEKDVLVQKQRLADIIEATNVGTWEWNIQTGETVFNERWAQIIGYTLEELAPINIDTWTKFVHPDDGEKSGKLLEEHFSGKKDYYRYEARMQHKNGDWIWILDIGKVVSWTKDGKPLLMSGTHQDITDGKKLWNELVISKEKAEESDRLKSAFLATMNHELRTPLNHILGFSDIIPDMTNDEGIKEFSKLIHKSGTNLLNIIEDIFDLAMIEQTEITVRKNEVSINEIYVDLKTQIQETLNEFQKADLIKLNCKIDNALVSQRILLDKPKVMQVMSNLIKNAIKYTDTGNVDLEISSIDKDFLLLSIKDTGIGIAKEKQQIIFEFFRQGDHSNTREHGGVGIGLAIAQKIAKAMDSKIIIKSKPGEGSTFTFKIPIQIINSEDKKSVDVMEKLPTNNSPDFNGKKILIAEDDDINRILIEQLLEETKCELLMASNGQECCNIYKEHQNIDLILMDIKLPVMNGLEATTKIRKENSDIPIIAMTSYSLAAVKKKALNARCNDVITKPIVKSVLYNTINKYLKQ